MICSINIDAVLYFQTGEARQTCPIDFPYAFKDGRYCCKYGTDADGNGLHTISESCSFRTFRPCKKDSCVDNGEIFCNHIIVKVFILLLLPIVLQYLFSLTSLPSHHILWNVSNQLTKTIHARLVGRLIIL